MLTYTDLLNIASNLLALDGWIMAVYMFFIAIIAACFGLHQPRVWFFWLWFVGILIGLFASGYTDVVIEGRLPYVFMFCLGIVGIGVAVVGFFVICFAPAVFAFRSHLKNKWLLLAANVPLLFPFGPVILFFFVFREYSTSLATASGDAVQQPVVSYPG